MQVRKPAIELAELERSKNGIGFVRKHDDLMKIHYKSVPVNESKAAAALSHGERFGANGHIVEPQVWRKPEQNSVSSDA